jgi:alpha-ketoglutarate-dependent 2,4-dichlorophenoxyacetate dioxygenase
MDDLSEDVKLELLEGDWTGAHCRAHSRKLSSPEYFRYVDVASAPMARNKILQRHEPSGRPSLYVGAYLHHLEGEGITPERSAELVGFLNAHVSQDKYAMGV